MGSKYITDDKHDVLTGRAFISGIKKGSRYLKTVVLIYFIQILLAIIVAIQFSKVFGEGIGFTATGFNLLTGYDHSIIADFRRVWNEGLLDVHSGFVWICIIFLMVSVFLNGGMIHAVTTQNRKIGTFIQSGARYYFPFIVVLIFSLLGIILWGALTLLPLTNLYDLMFEARISESQVFWIFLASGLLFTLGFALIFNWSVLSRIAYIRSEGPIFQCMGFAMRDIFRKFPRGLGLFLLYLSLQIILILIYWTLDGFLGMRSRMLVIIFFLVQQLFVGARIFWRIMLYASIQSLYRADQDPRVSNSIPSE